VTGCLRGCLVGTGAAVVLLAAAWGGWQYGGEIFPRLERWVGAPVAGDAAGPAPSREIADEALDRFNAFRTAGRGDSTLYLSAVELTSIVRYALPEFMPEGIREPTVGFDEDRVVLSARVALDAFPDVPGMQEVRALLPDTVRIRMSSTLLRLDEAYAALVFDGVEASGIPLPDRVIPSILASLGRTDRPGLPQSALAVPLPSGIRSAYTADGSLVFVSTE
jgi:hypothetical protein